MNRPPLRRTPPTPPSNQNSTSVVTFGQVPKVAGHRVVLYGPGGIGKTTLALLAEGKSAIVDADESLSVLRTGLEELGIALPGVVPAHDWKSLRASLQSSGWDGINNIILDTATKIEEWCMTYTLETVKGEKGVKVYKLEDYGYGKGYQHLFETFLPLLSDLDRHVRAGRNVFLLAHECVSKVPNPSGEDWSRYEPRLQSPSSGKASVRLRIKEWSDHTLFYGYDVAVGENGKAKGSGTRSLYTAELPFCMAKSRTTSEKFDIEKGTTPWPSIIK